MDAYTIVKFVHVMLAIIAVGFNASYAVWLGRAARQPEHERFAVAGVKALDDRFANPAYVLLLITGLLMAWLGDIPLTTSWILAALILYGILVAVALFVYTPTLRRQRDLLDEGAGGSPEYRRLSSRGTGVGIMLAVIVTAIVFLMVTKPTF